MPNKQCPTCKRIVSLPQFEWDMGAELPKDCPYCNKPIEKKEEKIQENFPKETKNNYHSWLPKGA